MDIRKKFLTVVAGFAVAALFLACGDDSGSNSSRGEEPSSEVAELELANGKAVVCDDDMEGVVAITADDGYRKCVDGEWIKIRKLEAMKADKIIGQLDDDDDDDDTDAESSSSQKQSSSSKKPSIFDEDDDDNDGDVIPDTDPEPQSCSSSSVIPSEVEGSSSSKGSNSVTPTEYVVDSYEDLPVCTAKREGSTAEVEDTGKKYKCEDGEWLAIKTTAKSSSSVIPNSSNSVIPSEVEGSSSSKGGSSVLYECPDGTVVANLENCKTPSSSSSDTPNTSASENPGTSTSDTPGTSSGVIPGTDPESSSDEAVDLSYATKCPAGHTCTYAPTEYLNPKVTYGELLDERDYQMYKTVEICDDDNKNCQTWMAQNLNYGGVQSWCYDNKASNCATYGRLYTWAAAVDSVAIYKNNGEECGYGKSCKRFSATALATSPVRGVCPSGWHLPSNAEWSTLYTNVGGSGTAGSLLKSTSGWNNGGNGTDKYGFSVLPAGYWNLLSGYFYDEGYDAGLWSASEEHSGSARYQYFYYIDDNVGQVTSLKGHGYGLRCLKDSPDQGGEASNSSSSESSSSDTPNTSASETPGTSASETPGTSSGVIPGTDPESSSDEAVDLPYATKCPAGHTCTYAPTEYLNPKITYGELLDERDYQMYKTVEICDDKKENCQTWMAQNLNYRYVGVPFDNGNYTSDSTSWCGGGSGTTAGDCSIYGRLYTWAAAVDSVAIYKNNGEKCGYDKSCTRFSATALATSPVRGVCPSGWHLPSNAEWSALYTNVGGTSYAGRKLKANSSLWSSNTGTDEYGFSVLPAGGRYDDGDFDRQGDNANFWSSAEREGYSYNAWRQYFRYDFDYLYQDHYYKYCGFSVRCLRDSN